MLGLIKVSLEDTDTQTHTYAHTETDRQDRHINTHTHTPDFLSKKREDRFDKLIMNVSFMFIQTIHC